MKRRMEHLLLLVARYVSPPWDFHFVCKYWFESCVAEVPSGIGLVTHLLTALRHTYTHTI